MELTISIIENYNIKKKIKKNRMDQFEDTTENNVGTLR